EEEPALTTVIAMALTAMLVSLVAGTAAPAEQSERAAGASGPLRPPYQQRGDELEARYQGYRQRLKHFSEALGVQLAAKAPDLRAKIEPPAPVAVGYRILPKVVPDRSPAATSSRIISTSFSWKGTERLVDRDGARLDKLETRLGNTTGLTD